ncbi:MAG: arylesterase [Candidatus Omnitrophica bacterium]|nr:arylesterase [Candidatus Omnitrophota bacterium]
MRLGKRVFFVTAAISLVVFSGCLINPQVVNLDSQGTTIVCFGDSITYGYGVTSNESYPAQLEKWVSLPVINAGLSGETTSDAIKRLETDILTRHPVLVIIEFGGNDLIARIPVEKTTANMEEMIKRIQQAGAMVAIADYSSPFILDKYHEVFRSLSKKYKTIFIPRLMSGIIDNPSLRSDYIHPNAKGYQLIAHRVARAIIPYLTRNAFLRKKANNKS